MSLVDPISDYSIVSGWKPGGNVIVHRHTRALISEKIIDTQRTRDLYFGSYIRAKKFPTSGRRHTTAVVSALTDSGGDCKCSPRIT